MSNLLSPQQVAAILERQQFIMKLARSFMMYVFSVFRSPQLHLLTSPRSHHRFGAPSHRLEAQMQATARVLEINCQVIYIPGVMLISFGDAATHTSEIKVRSVPSLSLSPSSPPR